MKDKKHTHPDPEAAPANGAGVVRALPPPSIPPHEQPNSQPPAPSAAAPDSQPVPQRDKRQPPGVGLKRIDEFIRRYPGKKPDPDAIRREYVKSVTAEAEDACHECLDRYIASDQVFREIVMNGDRWLRQQARNNWEGDWTRAQTKRSRLEERAADYARRREAEEKAHGD